MRWGLVFVALVACGPAAPPTRPSPAHHRQASPAAAVPPTASPTPAEAPAALRVRFDVGHEAPITVAAWRDARHVATASGEHVILWDLSGPTIERRLVAPAAVHELHWLADGSVAAVVAGPAVQVWRRSGETVSIGETENGPPTSLLVAAASAAVARVTDAAAGIVEIVDALSGLRRRSIRTGLTDVRLSGVVDADRALVVLGKGGARIFDLATGAARPCRPCDEKKLDDSPSFSPDGTLVATGSLEVFEVATGKRRARIAPWGGYDHSLQPAGAVSMGISWSPRGDRAVVFTELHIAHSPANFSVSRIYDARRFGIVAQHGGSGGAGAMPVQAHFFTPDGTRAVFADAFGQPVSLQVADAASGRLVADQELFTSPSEDGFGPSRFDPTGKLFIDAEGDRLLVREVDGGRIRMRFDGPSTADPVDVAFRDALTLDAEDGRPGSPISSWSLGPGTGSAASASDLATEGLRWVDRGRAAIGISGQRFEGADRPPLLAAEGLSAPDGSGAARVRSTCTRWSGDRDMQTCDASEDRLEHVVGGRTRVLAVVHDQQQAALAWSRDSQLVGVGERAGRALVIDVRKRQVVLDAKPAAAPALVAVAASPPRMAVGGEDTVQIFSASGASAELALRASQLVWTSDGKHILAAEAGTDRVAVLDEGARVVAKLALPASLRNRRAVVARDLAALVTTARLADLAPLQAALDLAPHDPKACFAIGPDLRFVAIAAQRLRLVRVADRRPLYVESAHFGSELRIVHDGDAFDGEPASLARAQVVTPEGELRADAPSLAARRRPGLLAAFLAGR